MRRYYGEFNYSGAIFRLYTSSKNMETAKKNLLIKLAKKLGLDGHYSLIHYFGGDRDNYSIKDLGAIEKKEEK